MPYTDSVRPLIPILQAARVYHRHQVVGMEHIPRVGSALIIGNHSLATYDIMLLMLAILEQVERLPRPLIDRLFFKIPLLGELCAFFGAVQGSHEGAAKLLRSGELVTVAPGGMREALRPSRERYQIRWQRRLGFVRLSMQTRTPIILAACPRADDLYDVYPSHLTAWFYRHLKLPIFLARGIGLTPLPRPVKLVHYLSEPLMPPPMPRQKERREEAVLKFQQRIVDRMHELIAEALRHED